MIKHPLTCLIKLSGNDLNLKYRSKPIIIDGVKYRELDLPTDEYAPLHSAFVRYIADNNINSQFIIKPYGDYVYTAIIKDYLPRFIKKESI